eukprot:scaffold2458_cov121-Isochrysis_galbana.AAC.7
MARGSGSGPYPAQRTVCHTRRCPRRPRLRVTRPASARLAQVRQCDGRRQAVGGSLCSRLAHPRGLPQRQEVRQLEVSAPTLKRQAQPLQHGPTETRVLYTQIRARRMLSPGLPKYITPWGDIHKTKAAAIEAHEMDLAGKAPDGGGVGGGGYPKVTLVMSRGGAPHPDRADRRVPPPAAKKSAAMANVDGEAAYREAACDGDNREDADDDFELIPKKRGKVR